MKCKSRYMQKYWCVREYIGSLEESVGYVGNTTLTDGPACGMSIVVELKHRCVTNHVDCLRIYVGNVGDE